MPIPTWLKGFYTVTTRYEQIATSRGETPPIQSVDSKYCRVQEVQPGKVYRLGFEDRNLEFVKKMGGPNIFWPEPDWDYNEPVLLVTRLNNLISVKVEDYDGYLSSHVYYLNQKILDAVGGPFKSKVGKTVEFTLPEEIIEEEEKKVKLPGIGTLLAIGAVIYAATRR